MFSNLPSIDTLIIAAFMIAAVIFIIWARRQ